MTACPAHLNNGPLTCRNDPCNGTHVYQASATGDRHDASEAAAEEEWNR